MEICKSNVLKKPVPVTVTSTGPPTIPVRGCRSLTLYGSGTTKELENAVLALPFESVAMNCTVNVPPPLAYVAISAAVQENE